MRSVTTMIVILMFGWSGKLSAQVTFEKHDQYNIGDTPYSLKVGDFNNDGFMDMVSGNFAVVSTQRISIILNNKFGGFGVSNLSAPGSVIKVDTADFNRDGNLDFVAADHSSDQISVFIGNGAGGFIRTDFGAGDGPNDIVTGDFNEDMNPDVAVLHRFSDDIFVYLGDGGGSLEEPDTIDVNATAYKLTAGDFKNHNHIGLVTGNDDGTVDFYEGDGTGDFGTAVPSAGFYGFEYMSAVDYDKNGDLDIVGAGSTFFVKALGNGDGTFSAATFLAQGGLSSTFGDFDNDGNIDLLSNRKHKVTYYPGSGSGDYPDYRRIPVAFSGWGMVSADWNNDGKLDFAIIGSGGGLDVVSVVYGKGDGFFKAPFEYPTPNAPSGIDKGDFDEDGLEDLVVCADGDILIYKGFANGSFDLIDQFDGGTNPSTVYAIHININTDSHVDLAVMDRNDDVIRLYTGDGMGVFSSAGSFGISSDRSMSVGDINKNNITDIILSGDDGNIQIFDGNGDNTFSLLNTLNIGEPVYDAVPALIDAGDNMDLAILVNQDTGPDQVRFLEGDGSGGFSSAGTDSDLTAGGRAIIKDDFENDGDIDFIVYRSGADATILTGDGAFGFSLTTVHGTLGSLEYAGTADMDGDGIKDLILGADCQICSPSGGNDIYSGNGDGTFGDVWLFQRRYDIGGFRFVISDFNNDGKKDIANLVNNLDFDGLSISLNTTPCTEGGLSPDVVNLPDLTDPCSVAMPTAPTASDNCGNIVNGTPDVAFPVTEAGTTIVTWTYDDGGGTVITQKQNVIITDDEPPVPDETTLTDISGECSVPLPASPTATDNCAGVVEGVPDVMFPVTAAGTTIVTWTYDDENGNTSTQTQNIIITDDNPPVPDDASLDDLSGDCVVDVPSAPTASDNCKDLIAGVPDVSFPITAPGITDVTWTYDDGHGNVTTQIQQVIITEDNSAPVPDMADLDDLAAVCAMDMPPAPTATDKCAGSVSGTADIAFPVTAQGTTVVTWSFDDGNGNVSTQTQNIIIADNEDPAPDLTALAEITGECSIDMPQAPTATDNCKGVISGNPDVTFPVAAPGTTVVTWTYDDGNGNVVTQSQNFIVDDNTAPVPDLTVLDDLKGACSLDMPVAPTATDNCDGSVTGIADIAFPVTAAGAHMITWTFTDSSGNSTTQTQEITVTPIDNTVNQNGNQLMAAAGNLAYQWIDCNDGGSPLTDETTQNYTPVAGGSYAVEISDGDCMVTSECIVVDILGFNGNSIQTGILIYPVPAGDVLYIDKGENVEIRYELLDQSGKSLIAETLSEQIKWVDLTGLSEGIYFLRLANAKGQEIKRIVKK